MNESQAKDQCTQPIGGYYDNQIRSAAGMVMAQGACAQERQTAKGQLRVRVRQLRREADRLEALAKALPEELPPMADEALFDLLTRGR